MGRKKRRNKKEDIFEGTKVAGGQNWPKEKTDHRSRLQGDAIRAAPADLRRAVDGHLRPSRFHLAPQKTKQDRRQESTQARKPEPDFQAFSWGTMLFPMLPLGQNLPDLTWSGLIVRPEVETSWHVHVSPSTEN